MNYTEKYHLPQWKKEDRIMMEDFNEAMSNVESGMAGNARAAAAAQATADNAQQIASAAYSPEQKPYVVGSYIGTNDEMTINIGFRPSFLIISGASCHSSSSSCMGQYNIMTAGNTQSKAVTFTDTGFILHDMTDAHYPNLINWHQSYDYIAFR